MLLSVASCFLLGVSTEAEAVKLSLAGRYGLEYMYNTDCPLKGIRSCVKDGRQLLNAMISFYNLPDNRIRAANATKYKHLTQTKFSESDMSYLKLEMETSSFAGLKLAVHEQKLIFSHLSYGAKIETSEFFLCPFAKMLLSGDEWYQPMIGVDTKPSFGVWKNIYETGLSNQRFLIKSIFDTLYENWYEGSYARKKEIEKAQVAARPLYSRYRGMRSRASKLSKSARKGLRSFFRKARASLTPGSRFNAFFTRVQNLS